MLCRVSFFATPWTATCQASLSFTIFQSLLKLMSNESVMPSNHLVLCRPLLLLPSIFLSIRVFSNMLAVCIRWQKYWSFSLSISPSNEYSRLISLRIDWFDLLADQGTLKSLLQHHSSKASVLQHSVYFIVQLSHVYMTTGKVSFDYTDLGRQREREWVPISTNSRQCVCVRTEPCSGGRHFSSPETLSGNSRLASMFPSSSGQLCAVCAGPTPHNLNVDIAQGQCLEGRTNGGSLKANVSTSGLTSLYTDTLACSLIPQGRI